MSYEGHPYYKPRLVYVDGRWWCVGWDAPTPLSAWFMWWYDGPLLAMSI